MKKKQNGYPSAYLRKYPPYDGDELLGEEPVPPPVGKWQKRQPWKSIPFVVKQSASLMIIPLDQPKNSEKHKGPVFIIMNEPILSTPLQPSKKVCCFTEADHVICWNNKIWSSLPKTVARQHGADFVGGLYGKDTPLWLDKNEIILPKTTYSGKAKIRIFSIDDLTDPRLKIAGENIKEAKVFLRKAGILRDARGKRKDEDLELMALKFIIRQLKIRKNIMRGDAPIKSLHERYKKYCKNKNSKAPTYSKRSFRRILQNVTNGQPGRKSTRLLSIRESPPGTIIANYRNFIQKLH